LTGVDPVFQVDPLPQLPVAIEMVWVKAELLRVRKSKRTAFGALSRRGRGRYLWKVKNLIMCNISERFLFFKGLLRFDEKNVFFGRYYTLGNPGGATD
jgi:hypothetical protein